MRRILFFAVFVLCTLGQVAFSNVPDSIDIKWMVDGNLYSQSTCEYGGDVILPDTPTKRGHTFIGWRYNYIELEYLESTGTQYIDTGIVADERTEAEIEFQDATGALFMATAGGWSHANFGILFSDTAHVVHFYMNCDGYTDYAYSSENPLSGNIKLLLTGVYLNDKALTITRGAIPSATAFSTKYPIYLFAQNNNGAIVSQFSMRKKIKYFKLWKDSVLVLDFIPVLDPDGVPCMYDRVTDSFFYNQGTGQFIAGPVKS